MSNFLVSGARVALTQTTLDHRAAYANGARMSRSEEAVAMSEISQFLGDMRTAEPGPDIVLLPELSIPVGYTRTLKRAAQTLNAIIIGGTDYVRTPSGSTGEVSNQAIMVIPSQWRGRRISRHSVVKYIRKSYPSDAERRELKKWGLSLVQDPTVWLFDGGEIGTFGVSICYDFLDLERVTMYRGQIQHLFVLAYNKDINSFDHAAEALARMIFCNVVICNCGHYGGSAVVSPYRRPEKRTIYRHAGAGLRTSQIVELPVEGLVNHQLGKPPVGSSRPSVAEQTFKGLPPGYGVALGLGVRRTKVFGSNGRQV